MKKISSLLVLAVVAGLTACSGSDKDQKETLRYELARTVIKSYDGLSGRSGKILYSDKDHILYYETYSDADSNSACDLYLLDHDGKTVFCRHRDNVLETEGDVCISEQYFFIDGETGVMRFYSDFKNDSVRLEIGRIDPESGDISQTREIDLNDHLLAGDRILSVDSIKGVPRIITQREKTDLRVLRVEDNGDVRADSYGSRLAEYGIDQILKVYSLNDGSFLVKCRNHDMYENDMIKIDTAKGDVKKIEVPYSYLLPDMSYGSSDPLFFKGATLCSYGADGVRELFDLNTCDLECYPASKTVPALCDDTPIFIASEGDELALYSLKKTSEEPDKDKSEITLAHIGPVSEELSAAVAAYNETSTDHKIVFVDDYMAEAYCDPFRMYEYSVADTALMASSMRDITERLEDDIKAGKGPDILIDAHLLPGLSDDSLIDTSEYIKTKDPDILSCAFADDMIVYSIDSQGLLIDREELTRVLDRVVSEDYGCLSIDDYLLILDSYGGSNTYGLSYLGPAGFNMLMSVTDKSDLTKMWNAFAMKDKGETLQNSRTFASLSDAVYYQSTEEIASDCFLSSLPSSKEGSFSLFASASAALTSNCSDEDACGDFVESLIEKDVQQDLGISSVSKKFFSEAVEEKIPDAADKFIAAAGEGRLVSYADPSYLAGADPIVIAYLRGEITTDAALDKLN